MPARWSAIAVTGPATPAPMISAFIRASLPQIFRLDERTIGYTVGHDKPPGSRAAAGGAGAGRPCHERGHGDVPQHGGRPAGAQRHRGEGPRPAGAVRPTDRRGTRQAVRAGPGLGHRAGQPPRAQGLRPAHRPSQRPAQHPHRGRPRAAVCRHGPAVRRLVRVPGAAVGRLQRRAARADPPLHDRGRPPPARGDRPPDQRRRPVNRPTTVGVLVLGTAAGLLLSLYGPALPELRSRYGIGEGASALVLRAHFLRAMTGIAWWGLERRLASRTWLVTGTGLLAAGAAAIAFAPAWPVVLAGAAGLGVGFGVIVVEINVLLAEGFGERAAAMLNLLGATFGAGAVAGPLILAATGGYRVPFCAGALLAVGAVALVRDLPRTAPPPEAVRPRTPPALVAGFVAVVALYVGTESGIGGFEATSLLADGTGAAAAAGWTAGYWAALTIGRLLAIPLALRVAPAVLAAGSLLAAAGGLGLAHVPGFAAVAYTLTGLVLGPVFPTVLAWLAVVAPGSRTSTAMVFAAGQLGGIVLPVVMGRLVDAGSPAVIPSAVLGVVLCCLGAVLLLRRPAGRALERAAGVPVSPGGGPGPSSGRR